MRKNGQERRMKLKKSLLDKCLRGGKGCLICAAVLAASSFFHGRAEAAGGKTSRFCIIAPPARLKPAVEPVRYLPGEFKPYEVARESGVKNFFKGQVKKIGFGTPDCFRINTEGAAAAMTMETATAAVDQLDQSGAADRDRIFPGVGYFNRSSSHGRRGVAFGMGIGESEPEFGEERGNPDARIGIVFGFSF